MYRWHIMDPVRFESDLKVTIQALSWRSGHRYLPLQDDIASVAFWYQTLPATPFPKLPDKDYLEVALMASSQVGQKQNHALNRENVPVTRPRLQTERQANRRCCRDYRLDYLPRRIAHISATAMWE